MIKNRIKAFSLLLVLLMYSTSSHAWLYWVIVDVGKALQRQLEIMETEANSEWQIAEMKWDDIKKKLIAEWDAMKEQEKTAAGIQAQTTAFSTYLNNHAEERYKPHVGDSVCRMTAFAKQAPENITNRMCEADMQKEDALINEVFSDSNSEIQGQALIQQIKQDTSTEESFLESLALAIDDASESLVNYQLIEEADEETVNDFINLAFNNNPRKLSPEELVLAGNSMPLGKLDDLNKRLIYQASIQRSVNRRITRDGATSSEALLIHDGSAQGAVELINEIQDIEMSDQAWRMIAILLSKQLLQQYRQLEYTLSRKVATAYKLKEIKG